MQRWRWEHEEGRRRIFARRRISRLSYGFSDEAELGTRYVVLMQTMIRLVRFHFFLHFVAKLALVTVEIGNTTHNLR